MNMDVTEQNGTYNLYASTVYVVEPVIHFWSFLISDICAFICSIFVLYHLIKDRQMRNALHNHISIIILSLILIYAVFDIPLHLGFLATSIVYPASPLLCLIWWYTDWGIFYTIAVLLSFASFERHILIFHSQMVATRRNRFIFHYIPLVLIMLFMMTFYGVAIFAPICESTFDYTSDLCGTHACYGTIPFFAIVELLGFGTANYGLIFIFSLTLLVRVIWQKHRIHRIVQWKKQRKLAAQTIALSLLFIIFSLPITIIYLVRLFSQPDWAENVVSIFFFLSYFSILFLPYVCLGNIPNLWNKLKNCMPRRWQRVAPAIVQS